jgi:putative membrane protein
MTLGVFATGCVLGLALFSQGLHWGLVHHERTVLAALIGLMVGSLRVLWPWPDGTDGSAIAGPEGNLLFPLVLAAVGAAVVLLITRREEKIAADVDAAGHTAEAAP